MYSRSRLPPAEEPYRSSIPPLYSGNRFRQVRRESTELPSVMQPQSSAAPEPDFPRETPMPEAPADVPSEEDAVPQETEKQELSGTDIRQEDKILLALLLLLSAEHEHAMDMIVILLLLLGIR